MIPTARIPTGRRDYRDDLTVAEVRGYCLSVGRIDGDLIPWVSVTDHNGRRLRLPTWAVLIDTAPIPEEKAGASHAH